MNTAVQPPVSASDEVDHEPSGASHTSESMYGRVAVVVGVVDLLGAGHLLDRGVGSTARKSAACGRRHLGGRGRRRQPRRRPEPVRAGLLERVGAHEVDVALAHASAPARGGRRGTGGRGVRGASATARGSPEASRIVHRRVSSPPTRGSRTQRRPSAATRTYAVARAAATGGGRRSSAARTARRAWAVTARRPRSGRTATRPWLKRESPESSAASTWRAKSPGGVEHGEPSVGLVQRRERVARPGVDAGEHAGTPAVPRPRRPHRRSKVPSGA